MFEGEKSAKAAGERLRFGDEDFSKGEDCLVDSFGVCHIGDIKGGEERE